MGQAPASEQLAQDSGTPSSSACAELEGQSFWANAFPILDGVDPSRASTRTGGVTGEIAAITSPTATAYGIAGSPSEGAYAFRVETDLQSIEVALSLPWQRPLVDVGATVAVRYSIRAVASNPNAWELGSVELRDDEGRLLAWVFEGGPHDLRPPAELEIEERQGCTFDLGRGPIVRRGLRVTADDAAVDVGFGAAADVGDFVVLHGNDTDDTAVDLTGCNDCVTDHRIAIAVVRGSQADLAAKEQLEEDAGL